MKCYFCGPHHDSDHLAKCPHYNPVTGMFQAQGGQS